jgi:hypothetical protein
MDKPIEDVLQLCLQDIESGRATIEDCLKAYPTHAAELAPLLKMAQALPRIPWSEPSPEFRLRSRQWLEQELAPKPATEHGTGVRQVIRERHIARLLAAGADEITAGRITVADFLARHPNESADLEPLLRLAFALPPIPWDGPSPEFAARAKAALRDEMDRAEFQARRGTSARLSQAKLANLLAECADAITESRATVADCLERYPHQARDLAPLLRIVAQMPPLPEAQPTNEFRLRGRQALLDAMEDHANAGRRRKGGVARAPRNALSAAAAGVAALTLVGVSAGVVFASQDSQPGDTLYPVKTVSEQVRILTAPNDQAKAQAYITVLDHRVDEIGKITPQTPPAVADSIASAYADAAQRAANLGSPSGTPNPLVANALQQQEQRLITVEETAPPTSRPAVTKALEASKQNARVASQSSAPTAEPKEPVAVPLVRSLPQRATSPTVAVAAVAPSPPTPPTLVATSTPANSPGLPPGSVPAPAPPGSNSALTPGLPPGSVPAPAAPTSTATAQATPGLPPGAVSAPSAPTAVITPGLPPGSVPAPGGPTLTPSPTPTGTKTSPR